MLPTVSAIRPRPSGKIMAAYRWNSSRLQSRVRRSSMRDKPGAPMVGNVGSNCIADILEWIAVTRPVLSAFAVLRLIMRLNRVGCTTSKSADLAPNEIEVPPYFVGVWVRKF